MRKGLVLFLIAMMSFAVMTTGCSNQGAKKKGRVTTAQAKPDGTTGAASDAQSEDKKDTQNGSETGSNDDVAGEADSDETSGSETSVYSDEKSNDILDAFQALNLEAESVDFADLKNLKLELKSATVLLKIADYTALSTYDFKIENGQITQNLTKTLSTGKVAQNLDLTAMPVLIEAKLDAEGKLAADSNKASITFSPMVTDSKLTLRADGAVQDNQTVLAELFAGISTLEALPIEGTGLFERITDNDVVLETDVRVAPTEVAVYISFNENGEIQTYLLKFKRTALNQVTE